MTISFHYDAFELHYIPLDAISHSTLSRRWRLERASSYLRLPTSIKLRIVCLVFHISQLTSDHCFLNERIIMPSTNEFASSQVLTLPAEGTTLKRAEVQARMQTLRSSVIGNQTLATICKAKGETKKAGHRVIETWSSLGDCYGHLSGISNSRNSAGDYHYEFYHLTKQIEKAQSKLSKIRSPDPLLSKAMTDVMNTASVARGEAFAELSSKHQGRVDRDTFEAGTTFFEIGGNHVSEPMTAPSLLEADRYRSFCPRFEVRRSGRV
jgi:hypothetical protein